MGEARRQFWEKVFIAMVQNPFRADTEQIASFADGALEAWETRWIIDDPTTDVTHG